MPFPEELSVVGQFKKLILAIWEKYGKWIKKVVVMMTIPRPDKETELEK